MRNWRKQLSKQIYTLSLPLDPLVLNSQVPPNQSQVKSMSARMRKTKLIKVKLQVWMLKVWKLLFKNFQLFLISYTVLCILCKSGEWRFMFYQETRSFWSKTNLEYYRSYLGVFCQCTLPFGFLKTRYYNLPVLLKF